jgi:hypothetical protein
MSLNKAALEQNYVEPLGMNSYTNPLQLQEGEVSDAWNADLYNSSYSKRKGIIEVVNNANIWTGMSITQGIEYITPAGGTKDIVFGTNGTSGGGSVATFESGTFTNIKTGLDPTARPFFLQLGSQLLFVNGIDAPFLYNDSVAKQYGITPPASLTAVPGAGSGHKLPNEQYLIAITYYNSTTKAESTPTFANPVVMGNTDNQIALTFAAADATTADKIRVYSSGASTNILLLEAEIGGTSTSYTANVADFALTFPQLELDNSRITDFTSSVNFPALIANRVFLKSATNEIRHSKIGQSGPMLESFEASAVVSTLNKLGAADDVIGLGAAGATPIIIKQRSVGRLDPLAVPDSTVSSDLVRYTYVELSDNIGGVYHGVGAQVYGEYVFLSRTNVFATDGKTVRPICDGLKDMLRAGGYTPSQISRLSAINDETNQRILISFFDSSGTASPDFILVGDYVKYPTFRWTVYRPGVSRTTHPGIKVGCFYSKRTNLGAFNYFVGNCLKNGQIYQLYQTNNDLNDPIYFKIRTKVYPFGDPVVQKLVKTCTLAAQGSGRAYNMQVSSVVDLGGIEEDSQDVGLDGAGSTWDNVLWDRSFWGGRQQLILNYEPHTKCRFFQLVFKQVELDAPLQIFNWDLRASVYGPF